MPENIHAMIAALVSHRAEGSPVPHLFLFLLGLAALIAGSEMLVRGASGLALRLGLSPLVIGLTVVSFGTSAPEVAVSVEAAWRGATDLIVGNVIGSNIFNILAILGLSALIIPLSVHTQVIRQELPVMIGAGVLLLVLGQDGLIGVIDASLLGLCLIVYTVFLVVQSRREEKAARQAVPPSDEDMVSPPALWLSVGLVLVGLALLVFGSHWLVEASIAFAKALGVSDLVIGLTVVAAGTSMPELAASIAAALKGERDMAVGNVIGSCTFNIFGCLGVAGLVSAGGLTLAPAAMTFDLWVMLATFVACLPAFISGREIARWEGAVFFAYYVFYVAYLILHAQSHSALGIFSDALMGFVLPLTVITLVVTMLRPAKH
jgi:cation:H+ antiporter